ncbi:TonB-dependent receptor [Inhella gelatinilytica]|uniref:TonB-dependent receptor n=1 Tax=Inhella gelatinilytica TaxID=2795030 RepID=A0A931NCY6_9BURK|nr:TonB-dependent receptor [Inhella gelatinilytica]MBH9552034.1 TonB-dependent receptor [Inhella gelatinilytica]
MIHRPTVLTLALAAVLPAFAQQASTDEKKDKTQLETVVITAERRVENIRDVPNAVAKISGEKLDVLASGGQDVRFLSGRVPSLNIESSYGRAFPRFYIRGYGNTDFRLNASQPVSLVYDDVIQENPILKGFPVFDVSNVEVIAGPQGTLFGRNTPAGVVKFESVRPSHKKDGYVSVSAGSQGMLNLEAAANLPLEGDWAARLSGQVQRRKDWVTNTFANAVTPKTEGYTDIGLRAQVLYEPHKQFSALFNLHHRDLDGSPRLFRANIMKPGTSDLVDDFDINKASFDGVNEQTIKQTGGSARLKWALPGLNVYSITGYESIKPFSRGDIDGGYGADFARPMGPGFIPFPVETSDGISGHRQLSQEVRLESSAAGPMRWQAGVYLFDEKFRVESIDYNAFTHQPNTTSRTEQTNKAQAVFGALNYDVSSSFKLRGGLRYTQDKKDLSTTGPVDTSAGTSAHTDDSKWNWDASATYALDKGVNLYTRYATGFRASSIQPASAFAPQSQAKPEDVKSFEVGLKGDFWNRKARLSASLFRYEVTNQQLTAVGGGANANRLINASKTNGSGFELNLDLLPTPDLLITAGVSLNNTKFNDPNLKVDACGSGCTLVDPILVPANPAQFKFAPTVGINGNPLPQAPKWTVNMTARWSFPLDNGDEIYVYTDWAYRSKINFFLYEAKEYTGKALTEGGLRVGYLWNDGKYEVAGYVRNLTNQIRATGGIDFNNLTGFVNEPRSYGVAFKAQF